MHPRTLGARTRLLILLGGALFPVFASAHFPPLPQPLFHPTIIEAPDGGPTEGGGINNSGVVLGSYSAGPFIWSAQMGFVPLRIAGDFVLVLGMNECNQVVGEMLGHATLWNTPTDVKDLGTLGGLGSTATAINDRGDVAGYASNGGDNGQPFLWTEEAGMRQIFDCGSYGGAARGINNRREIVGRCNTPGDRAFYWSERTGRINITVPGLPEVDANGINDRGEVVGVAHSGTAPLKARGFKWTREGGVVLLRDLGDNFSFARSNNRAGVIVGEAVDSSGIRNSVLWVTRDFGVQVHPGFGEGSYVGGGINDFGMVVDTVSFGPTNRDIRAVLWQPPEAGSRLLAKLGVSRCLRPKN